MALRLSVKARNALGNALNDLIDNGSITPAPYLEIRTGSRPANPDTPATGILLVTINLPISGFGSFSNGRAIISNVNASIAIQNDGQAGYFRIYNRDREAILDGSIGLTGSASDLLFDRVDFSTGGSIAITNLSISVPLDC